MGMIQTIIKRVPEGKTREQFLTEVERNFRNSDEIREADGWEVLPLTAENFEEHWNNQDNLKNTPEVKEKYRQFALAGRAIVAEIDW